ncbi:MAG TPA: DoxX family protein [Candidatus Cybelea sp.]|nr:DoxX family protein [Candidatus Cybelea sp.]
MAMATDLKLASVRLDAWAPHLRSVLRIMTALLFVEWGTRKLFGFPAPFPVQTFSLLWFAGIIETFGGTLVALGLFTRPVAFLLSGEMACAYFLEHIKKSFFPALNGGDGAVLFCFVFLYLVFAGPGPWSVDAARGRA